MKERKKPEAHKQVLIEKEISEKQLLDLYEQMLLIRKFELAVQENYKKGEIPGFIHLCIGQEAVAVGICRQLRQTDWVTSTHRGHGHALAKGVEVNAALAELYGKATGINGGRGGSMHLYAYDDGLLGTNGLVGGGIPLAVGLGMSAQVKGLDQVAVSFFGDGAVNHGTFHESLSLAAVQKAPVIFVCENNLYATCTPYAATGNAVPISGKAAAYGIDVLTVDGNDVLAVHATMERAVAQARAGQGPILIEALTYRTVGHHEGDVVAGTYRTLEEVAEWKKKCPILRFEKYLVETAGLSREALDEIIGTIDRRIAAAVEFARSSVYPDPATAYAHCFQNPVNPQIAIQHEARSEETAVQSWLVAVRDGIAEEMRADSNIIYIGEGIAERGGTFAHTKNLWSEFGAQRVIDTPICELAFTGAAAAASAAGCRAIADLMFADFIFEATSQIINQASKLRYVSNGQVSVPMIIRAGAGQIKQAGPQHSGTFHSVWSHIPGLVVVVPSTPADAKGLMKTALRAGDPVIFLEPKALFSTKGPVPVGDHYVPFGQARVVETGDDVTIVTFGLPVLACSVAAKQLSEEGIHCEVLDLRTLVPLDIERILKSVAKTGKLLVVEEAYATCSFASEIITCVMEAAFNKLDKPPMRLNQGSVPQPFSPVLESEVGINPLKVKDAVKALLAGSPRRPTATCFSGVDIGKAQLERDAVSPDVDDNTVEREAVETLDDQVEITIPNIGLTITEVEITQWLKKEGDTIEAGEELLDFESEKSVVALVAEVSGVLKKIVAPSGSTVPIGAVIGYMTKASE